MPEQNETLDRIHRINLNMLRDLDEIAKRHDIPYFLFFGGLLGAIRHKDFIPWDNDVDVVIWSWDFERLLPYLREELDQEIYELVMPEDYGKKYFDNVPRINYTKAEILMDPGYTEYYMGKANRICLDFYFADRVPDGFRGKLLVRRLELLYGLLNGKRYGVDYVNYSGIMKAAAFVLRIAGKCFSADTLRNRANKIRVKYDSDESVKAVRITNDTLHTFTLRFTEEHFSKMVPVPIGKDWFPGPVNPEECLTIRYGDYMTLPPEEERIPHWGFIAVVPENFVFEYDPRLDAGEQA